VNENGRFAVVLATPEETAAVTSEGSPKMKEAKLASERKRSRGLGEDKSFQTLLPVPQTVRWRKRSPDLWALSWARASCSVLRTVRFTSSCWKMCRGTDVFWSSRHVFQLISICLSC